MIVPSSEVRVRPVVAHSVPQWLGLTMPWVYNQIKYLKAYKAIVLSESTTNLAEFPWDPIYRIADRRLSVLTFRVLRKLKIKQYPLVYDRAIRKERPVILHSHFGDRAWVDLAIAKKHRLKHVVTFYGYDVNLLPSLNPVWRSRYLDLFAAVDMVLCEGPFMAASIRDLGCPPDKVKVQRLGIEVETIPFVPRRLHADGVLKILIAGSFLEKKGITYALEAIGALRKQYSGVAVTIIGNSTGRERSHREKERIHDAIRQNDLGSITRLLGYQSHSVLMKEMYEHHVFLSPSVTASDGDTEGGAPVAILEAMASGMPVVSTFHCDIPNIVESGKTGYLVAERDPVALSDVMMRLIENPEQGRIVAASGRDYVASNHDSRMQAAQLERRYQSVAERQSASGFAEREQVCGEEG